MSNWVEFYFESSKDGRYVGGRCPTFSEWFNILVAYRFDYAKLESARAFKDEVCMGNIMRFGFTAEFNGMTLKAWSEKAEIDLRPPHYPPITMLDVHMRRTPNVPA